jgi:hypothetical protein
MGGNKMKIKALIIFVMLSIKMMASDPSIMVGYGAAQLVTPDKSSNLSGTSYSLGLTQDFSSSETEFVQLSGMYSTTRSDLKSELSEIEILVALKKKLTNRQSVSVGFQVAFPFSNSYDTYALKGTGFGVNIGYSLQVFKFLSWNIMAKSTSYTVEVDSYEATDNLSSRSVSTYFSFGVN